MKKGLVLVSALFLMIFMVGNLSAYQLTQNGREIKNISQEDGVDNCVNVETFDGIIKIYELCYMPTDLSPNFK